MPTVWRCCLATTLAVVLTATAGGCPSLSDYSGRHSLRHDGRERSFIVHLPQGYSPSRSYPLVIVLHGGGGNAEDTEGRFGMSQLADKEGFVAVYPDGTGVLSRSLLTWNAGYCCGYALDNDVDDAGFIRAMITELEKNLSIDPGRIYATGMSNGGMMAYRLGAELSDILAAIAPVAGAVGGQATADSPVWLPPQPALPVSVLAVHGRLDAHVLYDGGHGPQTTGTRRDLSVAESVNFWVASNGCNPTPRITQPEPGVTVAAYTGGEAGTEVVLYTIEEGGHAWPRAGGDTATGLDAPSVIWAFFAAHPKE